MTPGASHSSGGILSAEFTPTRSTTEHVFNVTVLQYNFCVFNVPFDSVWHDSDVSRVGLKDVNHLIVSGMTVTYPELVSRM